MSSGYFLIFFRLCCFSTIILKCGAFPSENDILKNARAPTSEIQQEISDKIWVHVYKSPRNYDRIAYSQGTLRVTSLPQFDIQKPTTILYFPGWTENPRDKDSINFVTDALLMRDDVNTMVLDYSQNVQGDDNLQYLRSYINASTVGYLVGKWLQELKNQMPDMDSRLRLVGHSMGSHIMSFATNVYGKGKLRITALDPAYPLYFGPFAHLTAVDGSFVDIIHTDSGRYGHPDSLGHADFFPNNGVREQLYCLTSMKNETGDFCSHHMSYRYWAESAKPGQENIFLAKGCDVRSPCTIFSPTRSCVCLQSNSRSNVMGFAVDVSKPGNYYLETQSAPPFGLN